MLRARVQDESYFRANSRGAIVEKHVDSFIREVSIPDEDVLPYWSQSVMNRYIDNSIAGFNCLCSN